MSQPQPFEVASLLLPSLVIWGATLVAAWRVTSSPALALMLALVRTVVFAAYFGIFFDGTYTFLDDWTYLERGAELQAEGVGLFNMFDNLPLLITVGQGEHFLYYLYNAIAFDFFGEGYYAPVALNCVLTAVIAGLGTTLAVRERLVPQRQRAIFFAFMLLHPDILAWSTVLNGKDILVLLLHVLLLYAVSLYLNQQRRAAALVAAPTVLAALFLRYYVPILFAATWVVSIAAQLRGVARWRLLVVALIVFGGLFAQLGTDGLEFALDRLREDMVNPLVGVVRFAVTPLPFNTEPAYGFLDIPALFHWLMLPAVALGIYRVSRSRRPFSRFLLAYTLVFVSLYAIYGELQGPRHRVQLDFALAVYQFIGIGVLGNVLVAWRAYRRPAASMPIQGALTDA
jgi:hypothetical protein